MEKRRKVENPSKDEIEAIKEHVSYYKNEIIIWEEIPYPTSTSMKTNYIKHNHILDTYDHSFHTIFDLSKVKSFPDVEIRSILKSNFASNKNRILHGCFITPNTFLKITAKLIAKNYLNSISFDTKMEEDLNK